MWVVGQTATRCCVFFFNKIQHVLVEQNLIIGDSKVKNTELGIQRSEWVHSSPFINCVYPKNGAGHGDAEIKDQAGH